MKSILLLTDFSPNATAAAQAALELCRNMRLNLLLYNSYMKHMELPSSMGAGWDVEEFSERYHYSKVNMQTLTEGLEALVSGQPEGYCPVIKSLISDDDIGMSVEELVRLHDIELIVMGAMISDDGSYVHEMNINEVIDIAACPVLIIPAGLDIQKIAKVIFATDYRETDIAVLHFLTHLGRLMHYEIKVVHVHVKGEPKNNEKRLQFEQELATVKYTGLSYEKLASTNVSARLKHLCAKENGLLALVHHHTSLFAKVFEHSITKTETVRQQSPILVLPSNLHAYEHQRQ